MKSKGKRKKKKENTIPDHGIKMEEYDFLPRK